MGPEGELRVALGVRDGAVVDCRIGSTRPDVARLLLQGRALGDVQVAVARLFSVCAASQAAASSLALAAACGEAGDAELLARCRAAVAAETLRETALRVLLDWPRAIGETPSAAAIAAARAARAPGTGGAGLDEIGRAVFGVAAADWLEHDSADALRAWARAGPTASARFLDAAADEPPGDGTGPRLLAAVPSAACVAEIAQSVRADAHFAREPVWQGAPAETGALARLRSDPPVAALLRSGSVVAARFVARLRELALLLARRGTAAAGVLALADGSGVGWVENARGLLLHLVLPERGRAEVYRIVAPTDWNFHPQGALAAALRGAPAGDTAALRQRAARLVDSLDPCVACRVEIDNA